MSEENRLIRAKKHSATTASLHEAVNGLPFRAVMAENKSKDCRKATTSEDGSAKQSTNAIIGKGFKGLAKAPKADSAAAYRLLRLRKSTYHQAAFNDGDQHS